MSINYGSFDNHERQRSQLKAFIHQRTEELIAETANASVDLLDFEKFSAFLKRVEAEILTAFAHGYERGWNDAERAWNVEPGEYDEDDYEDES